MGLDGECIFCPCHSISTPGPSNTFSQKQVSAPQVQTRVSGAGPYHLHKPPGQSAPQTHTLHPLVLPRCEDGIFWTVLGSRYNNDSPVRGGEV